MKIKKQFNEYFSKQRMVFLIVLLTFFTSTVYIFFFTSKLSDVIIMAAERELTEMSQLIIGSKMTRDKFSMVGIDDIIVANRNRDDEIIDIDFKLDVAYDMMLSLRDELDKAVADLKQGKVTKNSIMIKDNLVVKVPFYTYTNNALLMNLGPKMHIEVNILEILRGAVRTEVKSYGINSVLINVYLDYWLTQSILFPANRENIVVEYELLVASKVVQGKVPSLYTGRYEQSSEILNIR